MSVGESRRKSWQRVSYDFSQAMRRRGGPVQRSRNLLARGDADDVDNDHGRHDHVYQKGNRSRSNEISLDHFAVLLWRLRLEHFRDRGKIWLDFAGAHLLPHLGRFYFPVFLLLFFFFFFFSVCRVVSFQTFLFHCIFYFSFHFLSLSSVKFLVSWKKQRIFLL